MTRQRIERGPRAFRSLFVLLAGIGLAAAVVAAPFGAAQAQVDGQSRGIGGPRLLMLPIVVHSAEDPEYLRDGLSDMLAARFDRIGALEIVRSPATSRGATDRESALKLARKAGVDYVLYGSFTRFGQGASLDVQCAPVTGAGNRKPLREIFVHSGSIGEIIPDLDELAGKVSRFARGENVETVQPAAPGGGAQPGAAARSASNAAVDALTRRVETLEATLRELLAQKADMGTDAGVDAGSSAELR